MKKRANYGVKVMTGNAAEKPVQSFEGGTVYNMEDKEAIVNMLCLGLIQGNFYQSEEDVISNADSLYKKAISTQPEFLAKAAVYARNSVGMKLQPVLALIYLSTLKDKTLFRKAFAQVIKTPKDLHDFMTLCRKTDIRKGVGRGLKNAINIWLNNSLSEYHACRYGGKLAEVLKVTRPVPTNAPAKALFTYISKGIDEVPSREHALVRAESLDYVVKHLNNGKLSLAVKSIIHKQGLQLEELKHTFGKLTMEQRQEIFAYFIPKLAYMATVSNLATIERAYEGSIPKSIIDVVASKLEDVEAYRKSRMLPFRLITARDMTSVRAWQRAIERVVSAGAKGTFDINHADGVMIGVDTSGSMSSSVTPSLTCAKVATTFGALVALGIEHSKVYAVASTMQAVNVRTDEVFTLAEEIRRTNVGYGTNFEQIMHHYNGEKFVILITDGESADNLERAWIHANKPAGAKLIVWQLMPYRHRLASSKRKDVIYLQGYSDALVGVIRNIIEGKGQLGDIEQITL